jgi:hypothetical protein
MLNNLSEQIRECLEHAEVCARKPAALSAGSPLHEDYLRLEKRWLKLARSFGFTDQFSAFMNFRNSQKSN